MSIPCGQRVTDPAQGCFHPCPWVVLPPNSAGLWLGLGKGEGDQFSIPLAEPFLCSAEETVHVLYSLFMQFTQFNNLWLLLLFHFGNPSTKVNI